MTALWISTGQAVEPAAPGTPPPPGGALAPEAPGTAAAGPSVGGSGIVVRLMADPPPASPLTVELAAAGTKLAEATLNDEGKDPDVTGGDGMYSGATFVAGDSFTVTVKAAGSLLGTTEVAWKPADAQRDLTLAWSGGTLTGEAGVSNPAPAPGTASPPTPGGAPASPGGQPGSPGGQPGGQAAGQPPAGPGGVATSADATWYLVFGGALLAAAALGYFWFRSRSAAPVLALPPGVARVAERGLFGPGTPSASGGPSTWTLPAEPEALAGLLGALAARRRVLVVVAEGQALPEVAGGPVHRIAPDSTDAVLDAAEELLGNDSGGAVLWLAPMPEGSAREALLAELPRGAGLLAAGGGGDPAWPAATLIRDDGWVLECGGQRRALRPGPEGFREG